MVSTNSNFSNELKIWNQSKKNRVITAFERLKTDNIWSGQRQSVWSMVNPVNSDPNRLTLNHIEIELDKPVSLTEIRFQLDQIG